MGEKIWTFGYIKIGIENFYYHKSLIVLEDVDIEKILVCNKISIGKKKL